MKLTIGIRQTISVGGFEFIHPVVEMDMEVGPGEDVEDVYRNLRTKVTGFFYEEMDRQISMVTARDSNPAWQDFLKSRDRMRMSG